MTARNDPAFVGYLSQEYCDSLMDGDSRSLHLSESGGWMLKRNITFASSVDARGVYPFMMCTDWDELANDIELSRGELVSAVLITDPLADIDEDGFARRFDRFIPFRDHMLVDLTADPAQFVSSHHRRKARIASRSVSVEVCDNPAEYGDIWAELYQNLIDRHDVRGLAAFSSDALRKQLSVPGTVLFRGVVAGQSVGMVLWYQHQHAAYYHLGAYNDVGYQHGASYAIFHDAIQYFRTRVPCLALGAGAGAIGGGSEGLLRFKSGWATGARRVFLVGKILDARRYEELTSLRNAESTAYFPAYRNGEFA